ncbi:hypothetical protein [Entomomonas asaccharolytica]|uniref:Uncharacterized protein n=1 Tax=Entomomonas asaccharolytica TaxID=2785331 RepID=A0A974RW33_9GAMM|nr:hypothetical protein [Entomomonas asaccharolytica]QQP84768.1 hypothetical protein JHT90_10165 [Entomomonas asaccharolytica]
MCFLFVGVVSAQGEGADEFTRKDITALRQDFLRGRDVLKDNGVFVDLKEKGFVSKGEMLAIIKKQGISSLFPNRLSYHYFIKYLQYLVDSSELSGSIYRMVSYKEGSFECHFILQNEDDFRIILNVLTPTNAASFPYAEQSYIYYFEKVDGKVVLAKMDIAG